MTERLLQFIWQFQHFNRKELRLDSGEVLQVLHPGQFNTDQGPDFREARIMIGKTLWVGHVELHVRTADWTRHAHDLDRNYDNVILHVVWRDEGPAPDRPLPLLTLEDRVPKLLLKQYAKWMEGGHFIPCGQQLGKVNELVWALWKERLVAERLIRRSVMIKEYLRQNNHHWEEVFWWLLARNFGIRVNAEAFEAVARSISIRVLARHKNQIHQLEAFLLGQAGLLNREFSEDYPSMLRREYQFFQRKYRWHPIHQPVHFLRMRPENFPTVRLAQLSMLIHQSSCLFSTVRELEDVGAVVKLLQVTANDYWHYHYVFDECRPCKPKRLGRQMVGNIIINTLVPAVFTYGSLNNEPVFIEKAMQWLRDTPAENNSFISGYSILGIQNRQAFDSQSLMELKARYCLPKRCLDCGVGASLLAGRRAATQERPASS